MEKLQKKFAKKYAKFFAKNCEFVKKLYKSGKNPEKFCKKIALKIMLWMLKIVQKIYEPFSI